MKVLHCSDVGFECEGVIKADSEEEVLRQATEHTRKVHKTEVDSVLADRVRSAIRDEPA